MSAILNRIAGWDLVRRGRWNLGQVRNWVIHQLKGSSASSRGAGPARGSVSQLRQLDQTGGKVKQLSRRLSRRLTRQEICTCLIIKAVAGNYLP